MDLEVEGIVVSDTPYGESSKIINILTKEKGIIGVMCKGAKSIKNKNRAFTNKLTLGKFIIKYKENKLSTLVSADTINPLLNIRKDIVKIGYLTYITELAYGACRQSMDTKDIYLLLKSVILKIESGLEPLILTNIFEIKMLDYLGVHIDLDRCVKCGNTSNIVSLDGDSGGYICSSCLTYEKVMDEKVLKMFRLYYYVDIDSISDLKISSNVVNSIDSILKAYYDRYTGLYLKSKDFLKVITKNA